LNLLLPHHLERSLIVRTEHALNVSQGVVAPLIVLELVVWICSELHADWLMPHVFWHQNGRGFAPLELSSLRADTLEIEKLVWISKHERCIMRRAHKGQENVLSLCSPPLSYVNIWSDDESDANWIGIGFGSEANWIRISRSPQMR
jgi:hypothetical protein